MKHRRDPPGFVHMEYASMGGLDAEGGVLLTGVPSYGNVGPIAVRLLLDRLPVRLVGTFQGDDFPPVAYAWKGTVTGPVQVWASDPPPDAATELQKKPLLILNSDVSIPQEHMMGFARVLTEWASERLLDLVVVLEGCPRDCASGAAVATNVPGAPFARKVEALSLDARLTGFTAALLGRANRVAVPAVGLLAPVENADEDAAAAGDLLRIARPLLPEDCAPEEALAGAEAMQAKIRAEREAQRTVERTMRQGFEVSYV